MKISHPLIATTIGIVKKVLIDCEVSKLIVGVSGGQDSIALLKILEILSKSLKFNIIVVHFNHGIRKESNDEEMFVTNFCNSLNIEIKVFKLNLEKKTGLADSARLLRKKLLEKVMKEEKADVIVLGHTLTDQFESVMMHLIRGCGLNGFKGMSILDIKEDCPYIRPFLKISRENTEELCKLFKLDFVSDPTNDNTDLIRTFLRHSILPQFKKFNPNIEAAVSNFSDQCLNADEYLESIVKKEELKAKNENLTWDTNNIKTLNKDLRLRFIRLLCKNNNVDTTQLGLITITKIDHYLLNNNSSNIKSWNLKHIDQNKKIILNIKNNYVSFSESCKEN